MHRPLLSMPAQQCVITYKESVDWASPHLASWHSVKDKPRQAVLGDWRHGTEMHGFEVKGWGRQA